MSKSGYYIAAGIGGTIGSVLGSYLDGGNFLGFWSIVGGLFGGLVAIYLAYKFTR
jgi:hypothetical protein